MKTLRFFWSELMAIVRSKDALIPVLGLLVIPLMYSGVYLVANWDPYSNVKNIPVAVVNEDRPVMFEGKEIAIGRELIEKLHDNDAVQFHFVTRQEGERGLSENKFYLLIRIPEEMSHNATTILDTNPEPMNLIYTENSSFNFLSGQISDKVVQNIKSELSQKVTETYVEQMFNAIGTVAEGLGTASDGAGMIEDGLGQLGEGLQKFRDELNSQVNSKTSEADSMVQKMMDENREKLDELIHQEIDEAMDKNKPKFVDKIHQEIDTEANRYTDIVHDTVHVKIDELVNEYSLPTKEKLHEQIDKQSVKYGDEIRKKLHDEIDNAYEKNINKVMSTISRELDKSIKDMEPVARTKMHTIIDREYGKIESSIQSSIHKYIDEKVDKLFDDAIQKGKTQLEQIQADLDQLEEKLKPIGEQLPPDMQQQWEDMKKKLEDVRAKIETSLTPDNLEQLKKKVKQDLTNMVDNELNKVGKKLVSKLHHTADTKFDEIYPKVRSMAQQVAMSKTNELAPALLAKAHTFAEDTYQEKSKLLTDKLHKLVDDKWTEYEPKVVNNVHHKVNDELDRVMPEVIAKIHQATDDKVNSLEPMARDMMHEMAEMKLDDAAKKVQTLIFEKMSDMLNQVEKAQDAINDGFAQLLDGQQKLLSGGAELRDKLREGAEKATQDTTDKTYQFITSPVNSSKQENHDVTTYGVGMAPYFLSLGFFVGALMFSMIYPLYETSGRPPSGFAWMMSKYGFMMVESSLQVLISGLVVLNVIGLPVMNVTMFFVVCVMSSLTFFAMVQFFITSFGNVGRFIIVILLVLQLSSTAGSFPIEMAPEFFQMLHPWFPMTYTIRAFRGVIALEDMGYVWMNLSKLSIFLVLSLIGSFVFFRISHRKLVKRERVEAETGTVVTG
ncbi:YhgE/Pip family protein [Paenibacillus sp. OSY-SE]|uniref:YhgE/Pip family protein n=1 Tax=Paenibacillus sp. OSY-SE TaxID=1196323 RepID=UPI0002D73EE7|nr:YhgE/Pip domain-containing protein [Paenibacillus sp. OSY-SE]